MCCFMTLYQYFISISDLGSWKVQYNIIQLFLLWNFLSVAEKKGRTLLTTSWHIWLGWRFKRHTAHGVISINVWNYSTYIKQGMQNVRSFAARYRTSHGGREEVDVLQGLFQYLWGEKQMLVIAEYSFSWKHVWRRSLSLTFFFWSLRPISCRDVVIYIPSKWIGIKTDTMALVLIRLLVSIFTDVWIYQNLDDRISWKPKKLNVTLPIQTSKSF